MFPPAPEVGELPAGLGKPMRRAVLNRLGSLGAAPTITRGSWEHSLLLSLLEWRQEWEVCRVPRGSTELFDDLGWRGFLHQSLLWGQEKCKL